MKLTTPEIVWHSKEPVFSADFHHSGELWRLATGGADKDVKIWKVVREKEGGRVKLVFMSSLSRHTGSVNVVRFSPNGEFLASAGDDNVVCLWKMGDGGGGAGGNITMDTATPNKENWSVTKMLRGHLEDIYDACWSANSSLLATGSVDNTAIIWDPVKGQSLCTLGESKQYVQGVSWDPIGQYLATLSNDRHLRIYSAENKYKCIQTVGKMTTEQKGAGSKSFRMWIDESLSFFFRRLTFSPDGSLLVVPAGRFESGDKTTNMTYIFTRTNLAKPAVSLPCPEKASVVVKFSPVIYKLRDSIEKDKCLFSLPYRMVYAVASLDAVLLYDTQQTAPFAYLSNIHYSGVTDLAWSDDGLVLVVTSSDAYCSIVTFDPDELGTPLETENLPDSMKLYKNADRAKKTNDGHKTVARSTEERSPDAKRRDEGVVNGEAVGAVHRVGSSKVGGGGGGSVCGGAGEGVREVVKEKRRRINTTMVESFTSPSSEMKRCVDHTPSPLTPAASTDTSTTRPPPDNETRQTSLTSISDNDAAAVATSDRENGTAMTCPGKKPRRIQLETLSSAPLQSSHDSEPVSRDLDPAHLIKTPLSVGDNVEPMDVPTSE